MPFRILVPDAIAYPTPQLVSDIIYLAADLAHRNSHTYSIIFNYIASYMISCADICRLFLLVCDAEMPREFDTAIYEILLALDSHISMRIGAGTPGTSDGDIRRPVFPAKYMMRVMGDIRTARGEAVELSMVMIESNYVNLCYDADFV
jgi:hypothetical protein